jgi:nucleotide-binding universal stress UspA family protein
MSCGDGSSMPVVAAVDQSERAQSVVRSAKQLADDTGVGLHVVHVGEADVPSPEGGYDADREKRLSAQKATNIARDIGQDVVDIEEFEPVGLEGNPAEEILEHSTAEDAEYVVVSARKRSPVGQAVFGSVTQSVLLNADRPVVAVPHSLE